MKQLLFPLLAVSMLMAVGCENKQLIQCREDKLALQAQLTDTQKKLAQEKKGSETILENLMEDITNNKKVVKSLQEKIKTLTAENNKLKQTNKDIMTKTQRALTAEIGKSKNLQNKLAEADKKLKTATDKLNKSNETLIALTKKATKQNNKLKAEIEQLKAELAQKAAKEATEETAQ